MKKYFHFVQVPMTGLGLHGGYRGDDWFSYRIGIFKKYTLKSLLNQSVKDWILWMTFRPEEEYKREVWELAHYLTGLKVEFVFTFHGLMFHDDQFGKGWKQRRKNIRRLFRMKKSLWDYLVSIKEIFQDKNKDLDWRWKLAANEVERHYQIRFGIPIYVTRVDSDDCLHKDYLKEARVKTNKRGCVVSREGYIHDGRRMAEYNPTTNPPFYTLVFPDIVGFKISGWLPGFTSHEDVPIILPVLKVMTKRMFCVIIHDKHHISTSWNHPFRGKEADLKIKKDFGL